MTEIDWDSVKRPPTKKELKLYRRWRDYLCNAQPAMTIFEIESRAKAMAEGHHGVPDDGE